MEDSSPRLTSENDWTSETEVEESENGHFIRKCEEKNRERHIRNRIHWSIWIVTAVNIAVFTGTLILALHLNGITKCKELTDVDAIKRIKSYSPILNQMTPELQDVVFNGSLVNFPPSIYRSDPSEEVDAAWEKLGDVGWILITEEDVLRMGKDPNVASKAPAALVKAMGRSNQEDLYFAQIDVFHQLHCLNEIRRHAYWDHYHRHKWGAYDGHTPHPLHWTHISHCINAIRQNIMCNADVDMITSTWTVGQDWPFPDFNLHKKCRNFEQLRDWQGQNRIPEDLLDLLATPDDVELQTLSVEIYHAFNEPIPDDYPLDHEVAPHKAWDSTW